MDKVGSPAASSNLKIKVVDSGTKQGPSDQLPNSPIATTEMSRQSTVRRKPGGVHQAYMRSVTNVAHKTANKRLVPLRMLSIDTGIRGVLRRGTSLKAKKGAGAYMSDLGGYS